MVELDAQRVAFQLVRRSDVVRTVEWKVDRRSLAAESHHHDVPRSTNMAVPFPVRQNLVRRMRSVEWNLHVVGGRARIRSQDEQSDENRALHAPACSCSVDVRRWLLDATPCYRRVVARNDVEPASSCSWTTALYRPSSSSHEARRKKWVDYHYPSNSLRSLLVQQVLTGSLFELSCWGRMQEV